MRQKDESQECMQMVESACMASVSWVCAGSVKAHTGFQNGFSLAARYNITLVDVNRWCCPYVGRLHDGIISMWDKSYIHYILSVYMGITHGRENIKSGGFKR